MWTAVIALWETLKTVVDSTSLDGFFVRNDSTLLFLN